ncbi:hypothetical protein ABH976_002875 [Bradyrhizobium ottawaense]
MAMVRPYACSISTSAPEKSFGCRNSTGLPWAPIFGTPSVVAEHPRALLHQRVARGDDVDDLVADMVDAAVGIALEEFCDRRGLAERLDEFDLGVGERREHGGHAVLWQRDSLRNLGAERGAIDPGGLDGVLGRDRDMVEPAQHVSSPLRQDPEKCEAVFREDHAQIILSVRVPDRGAFCPNVR